MDEPDLDPVIHQRTRLTILSALYRNREASFTDLRDGLDLTGGNLKSHADRLEENGYVESFDALVDRSFEKRYRITEEGGEAFEAYLDQLRTVFEGADVPAPEVEGPDPEADDGRG